MVGVSWGAITAILIGFSKICRQLTLLKPGDIIHNNQGSSAWGPRKSWGIWNPIYVRDSIEDKYNLTSMIETNGICVQKSISLSYGREKLVKRLLAQQNSSQQQFSRNAEV